MVALAARSRPLDEQHGLQGQHVGADERLHHVEGARMKQETLVDLEPAMEHVDAQQVIEPRLGGLVVVAEGGCAGRLDATGKHVVDVPQELPHLVCRDQTGNDQKPSARKPTYSSTVTA